MDDRWFSVDGISEDMGVLKDTVYAWLNKRRDPAIRSGVCGRSSGPRLMRRCAVATRLNPNIQSAQEAKYGII
jgi:hypothetical protein